MEKQATLMIRGTAIEFLVDVDDGEIIQARDPITGFVIPFAALPAGVTRNWNWLEIFIKLLEDSNHPAWEFIFQGINYDYDVFTK